MRKTIFGLVAVCMAFAAFAQSTRHQVSVSGTSFYVNDTPFVYTGISFFNAMYNAAFNKNPAARKEWLTKFRSYGINVLRIWAQWDNARGFVDAGKEATLYFPDGRLRPVPLQQLKAILTDADEVGMMVQLALFSRESWRENIRLSPEATDRAVAALTKEMQPYRNLMFQIWNEFDERVLESYQIIKAIDPNRLVTNSPGVAGVLGETDENERLDYLTPHTTRQGAGRHWEIAPREIDYLLHRYRKPVVDDEPARNGTPEFGGPKNGSFPLDHMLQIHRVWQLGAYITYHHDMFQKGYGDPSVPPHGIPDPEFNPYHRQVFEFIIRQPRYRP